MEVNGIDLSGLEAELPLDLPDKVAGRRLQVDGDQLCYLAGCFDDEPFAVAKRNFTSQLETWMLMAGAELCTVHLTGDNKGGRFAQAIVKEYQANRKGKAKPKHLSALRAYVRETRKDVIYHDDQEADDGMAQGNYNAMLAGDPSLSVICSADKDLRMCSGWHLNQRTGELIYVSGYGSIELTEGKPKKIVGYGTSFFWAQMLMGDTADNIPGLPALGPDTLVRYKAFHTAALIKLLDTCESTDAIIADRAAQKITDMKHKACGAVAAYHILGDAKDDAEAMYKVIQCYRDHYPKGEFKMKHWNGEEIYTTIGSLFIEQAELLWMRRTAKEHPVTFIQQVLDGGDWNS
jgi:hypothetical protein